MPEIAITINGRNYRVTCGAGEEERLQALAKGFDQRVQTLVRSVGQAGEAQLLVVTSLMLADEADEVRGELDKLRGDLDKARADVGAARTERDTMRTERDGARSELGAARAEIERVKSAPPPAPRRDETAERQAAALIDNLTRRIEAIAEELERA